MSRTKKKRVGDDFDDSTPIANMNVDGMPWYVPSTKTRPTAGPVPVQDNGINPDPRPTMQPLSRRETWRMIITAVSAALLIAFIFLLGAFLFILFALHVWLK